MEIYLNFLHEITKIITIGVEIGIEMDDINRETIIVKQNPLITNQLPRSALSNSGHTLSTSIFYDEREKEYNKLE